MPKKPVVLPDVPFHLQMLDGKQSLENKERIVELSRRVRNLEQGINVPPGFVFDPAILQTLERQISGMEETIKELMEQGPSDALEILQKELDSLQELLNYLKNQSLPTPLHLGAADREHNHLPADVLGATPNHVLKGSDGGKAEWGLIGTNSIAPGTLVSRADKLNNPVRIKISGLTAETIELDGSGDVEINITAVPSALLQGGIPASAIAESGTFTPTLINTPSGASIQQIRTAQFTRIGDFIYIVLNLDIQLNSTARTSDRFITIGGLPFPNTTGLTVSVGPAIAFGTTSDGPLLTNAFAVVGNGATLGGLPLPDNALIFVDSGGTQAHANEANFIRWNQTLGTGRRNIRVAGLYKSEGGIAAQQSVDSFDPSSILPRGITFRKEGSDPVTVFPQET